MLAAGLSTFWKSRTVAAAAAPTKNVDDLQKNWRALLADGAKVPLASEPLKLSKDEWRKRLTPDQFHILREEGTEREHRGEQRALVDAQRAGERAVLRRRAERVAKGEDVSGGDVADRKWTFFVGLPGDISIKAADIVLNINRASGTVPLSAPAQAPRWRASPNAASVPSNTEAAVAATPTNSELPSAFIQRPPPSTSWYQRSDRPRSSPVRVPALKLKSTTSPIGT